MTDPDPHEDEFFRAGEGGTYDGGPQSLAPVKLEDWATPPAVPTEEQLARRKKLRRVVLGVVGAISVMSLVGATVRVAISAATSRVDTFTTTEPGATPAAAPAVPAPERDLGPVALAEPEPAARPSDETASDAPSVHEERRPSVTATPIEDRPRTRGANVAPIERTRAVAPRAIHTTLRSHAAFPEPARARSLPPTATFPDPR